MRKITISTGKQPTYLELKLERDILAKTFCDVCDLVSCCPDSDPIPKLKIIMNNYEKCRKQLHNLTKQEG